MMTVGVDGRQIFLPFPLCNSQDFRQHSIPGVGVGNSAGDFLGSEFPMGTLYSSDSEAALHEAAIDALATEMRLPAAEVKVYYERELERLGEGARIRDFLSVCTTRHIRAALRGSSGH